VKRKFIVYSSIILTMLFTTLMAQQRMQGARQQGMMMKRIIKGQIVDAENSAPLEYANIVLKNLRRDMRPSGTVTDAEGKFQLEIMMPGIYSVKADYIGYYAQTIDSVIIRPRQQEIDLGIIHLKPAVLQGEDVTVEAERVAVEYQIDKKVINVDQHYTAVSGTAVDVLENVPSVSVDVEGNVSLRGSENFTVLVDNRPTVLEPSDALMQIPSSSIKHIEIITNPSAKYDPDGTSGIVNVITKKRSMDGASGIANISGGLNDKYGVDFLLNYRFDGWNFFLGADYNKRTHPGSSESQNETTQNDTTSFVYSEGDARWMRVFYGLRAGFGYQGSNDDVQVGFRYGSRDRERRSDLSFDEWTEPGDNLTQYISESVFDRGGDFYSINMDYTHSFAKKGHEIATQVNYSRRGGDEDNRNALYDLDGIMTSGQKGTESGPSRRWRIKLDYTLPLGETNRFEAGLQSRIGTSDDENELYEYQTDTQTYQFMEEFSHDTQYDREIHSLYTIYAGELGRFGYQGGVRGEYTFREITMTGEGEPFKIDRWDVFPTFHFSYKYSTGHQIMTSYTRRIERSRGWYLEPFLTWSDAYNVRRGNPDLKPEYIDSYELGYQKIFGKSMLSFEAYRRITHNKVERVRSVYAPNVMLHTIDNVGKDYLLGAEIMLNLEMVKAWNLNLMGDLYDYKIEGELYGASFSRGSFNWRVRMNNTFQLWKSTRLQINGFYNSPSVRAQGRREGFIRTDFALRQEFMDKKFSATLQVRDLFGLSKFEFESEGPNFFSHTVFERESPIVMLTLQANFNNYRRDRKEFSQQEQESFEGEEEF